MKLARWSFTDEYRRNLLQDSASVLNAKFDEYSDEFLAPEGEGCISANQQRIGHCLPPRHDVLEEK